MAAVARKDGKDSVASPDGLGDCCASPSTKKTAQGSGNVFVNKIGAVRDEDKMIVHNYPGPCCNPHEPKLSTFSKSVFCNGKGIGRDGDKYGGDHIISSGSPNVFAGD